MHRAHVNNYEIQSSAIGTTINKIDLILLLNTNKEKVLNHSVHYFSLKLFILSALRLMLEQFYIKMQPLLAFGSCSLCSGR